MLWLRTMPQLSKCLCGSISWLKLEEAGEWFLGCLCVTVTGLWGTEILCAQHSPIVSLQKQIRKNKGVLLFHAQPLIQNVATWVVTCICLHLCSYLHVCALCSVHCCALSKADIGMMYARLESKCINVQQNRQVCAWVYARPGRYFHVCTPGLAGTYVYECTLGQAGTHECSPGGADVCKSVY